jgi:hypothetical protein
MHACMRAINSNYFVCLSVQCSPIRLVGGWVHNVHSYSLVWSCVSWCEGGIGTECLFYNLFLF